MPVGKLRAVDQCPGEVRQYNTARETFPTSILAGMFGFQPAALFELKDEVQREAPKVKFT